MKLNWIDVRNYDRSSWKKLCPENEFRVYTQSDFPSGLLPNGLLEKANSVIVVSSGCPSGEAYWMAYVNRVDNKAHAVDGEPFMIGFVGDTPLSSGFFAHHGDWLHRTIEPSDEFWEHIHESGIKAFYHFPEMPSATAGSLSEIDNTDTRATFSKLVKITKDKFTCELK